MELVILTRLTHDSRFEDKFAVNPAHVLEVHELRFDDGNATRLVYVGTNDDKPITTDVRQDFKYVVTLLDRALAPKEVPPWSGDV